MKIMTRNDLTVGDIVICTNSTFLYKVEELHENKCGLSLMCPHDPEWDGYTYHGVSYDDVISIVEKAK